MEFFKQRFATVEEARATGRGTILLLEVLKFLAVAIVTMLPGTLLGNVLIYRAALPLPGWAELVSLYVELIGIGMVLLYCKVLERRNPTSLGFRGQDFWKQYLKGLGVGFGMFTLVVLLGWALGGLRFAGLYERVRPGVLLLFFLGYMIQGMYEEVLCRGYFMISTARKNSVLAAVIANAALFSLLHLFNPGFGVVPAVNILLFGLFASLYMLKTDNIWGVGAIHSVWNFAQGCFYGLSVSGMPTTSSVFVFASTDRAWVNGGAFGPEGGVPVTLVCLGAIALVLLRAKGQRSAE